ncbi:hypothetical protein NQ318_007453 [Aromia moschata]|uniref:Uncharacterized protein n=1 Tax=Aromia moschata TaxID=1265417 RepID=A0AAV8YKC9_9CUCU|nr:hypothetical protein NQ318_007453 [Aromia moschata]
MRLKTMDGPFSFHNGNNDILNSPKRINTLQNSNVTSNYSSTTSTYTSNNSNNTTDDVITALTDEQTGDLNILNNVAQEKVQWCNPSQEAKKRELTNNANNRNNQLLNINNTLAASLRNQVRVGTASSICSESSPDDSLLDYEGQIAQRPIRAAPPPTRPPQDEDRGFDLSDSESSEEGNLSNGVVLQRRGIVNPNYPGFQHLAHTLDYGIRGSSDTDLTDDDFECDDSLTAKLQAEANVNNNNVEDTDYQIDSVNRLDSVENIQKVFYDKPVFNIEEDCEFNQQSDSSSGNSNQSDEDTEIHVQKVDLNIKVEEKAIPRLDTHDDIVGNFSKEIEVELERVAFDGHAKDIFEDPYSIPKIGKAIVQELEEAVEKLQVIKDLEPSAVKYYIEPNIEEPFNKLSPTVPKLQHTVLEDSKVVKASDTMTLFHQNSPLNLNENTLKATMDISDAMNSKVTDAFLSSAQEELKVPLPKEDKLVDDNLNINKDVKMDVDGAFRKPELTRKDSNRELEEIECQIKKIKSDTRRVVDEVEKFCKEDITKDYKEKEEDSAVPKKKEKVEYVKKRRDYNQQFGSLITFPRRELGARSRDPANRRSVPVIRDKKKASPEVLDYIGQLAKT